MARNYTVVELERGGFLALPELEFEDVDQAAISDAATGVFTAPFSTRTEAVEFIEAIGGRLVEIDPS